MQDFNELIVRIINWERIESNGMVQKIEMQVG